MDSTDEDDLRKLLNDLTDAEQELAENKDISALRSAELSDMRTRHAHDASVRDRATAGALALFQALVGVCSCSSGARRRVLYLRDFGTMSYIFRPLVSALLRAVQTLSVPVVTIAGIWRFDRPPGQEAKSTAKHGSYLSALESPESLMVWLKRKFPAVWRKAKTNNERFTSLSHSFSAVFPHRFGVWELGRRSYSQSVHVDQDSQMVYERAFPVGLHGHGSHALALRWGADERARRVTAHNMRAICAALEFAGCALDTSALSGTWPSSGALRWSSVI